MARKVDRNNLRRPRTIIVGAGVTEYWYLSHLKRCKGYRYVLQPSLFGDESMLTIKNRILEGLDTGATVVCVFDEDVRQWNNTECVRMDEIHRLYDGDGRVVIASSMPSIEYWLLLHFENTCRYFGTSSKVIECLRKYLPGFEKRENYLRHERWIRSLVDDGRMEAAYKRAKSFGRSGESYSDMWKAIDKFEVI